MEYRGKFRESELLVGEILHTNTSRDHDVIINYELVENENLYRINKISVYKWTVADQGIYDSFDVEFYTNTEERAKSLAAQFAELLELHRTGMLVDE